MKSDIYFYAWGAKSHPNDDRLRWILSPGLNNFQLVTRFMNLGHGKDVIDYRAIRMGIDFIIPPSKQQMLKDEIRIYFENNLQFLREAELSVILNQHSNYNTTKRFESPIDGRPVHYSKNHSRSNTNSNVRRERVNRSRAAIPDNAWDILTKLVNEAKAVEA